MKYLEELRHGDCFKYNETFFVLTSDFKNNHTKLCYSLIDGNSKWFSDDTIVDLCPMFTTNEDNQIIPIK